MKKFDSYLAISLTSVFLALLVVLAEIFSGFKILLTRLTGSHWSSKFLLATLIFFSSGFGFGFLGQEKPFFKKTAFSLSILSLLVIFSFFLSQYFSNN